MLSPLCDLVSNSIAVASKPQIVDIDSDEELEKKVVRKIDWVHKFYDLVIVSTNLYLFLSIISLRMTIQFCRKRKNMNFPHKRVYYMWRIWLTLWQMHQRWLLLVGPHKIFITLMLMMKWKNALIYKHLNIFQDHPLHCCLDWIFFGWRCENVSIVVFSSNYLICALGFVWPSSC